MWYFASADVHVVKSIADVETAGRRAQPERNDAQAHCGQHGAVRRSNELRSEPTRCAPSRLGSRVQPSLRMAPKRKAGAKAKSAAAASSDTVGIPELFKKVKADLQPNAKLAPQIQEKAALEPASVARSAADGAGGSNDAASAAAAARAPTVPLAAAAAPPQVPLTAAEDELLRDFDLDIAFGPSLGLTRKERWQRAQGAPPPAPLAPSPASRQTRT